MTIIRNNSEYFIKILNEIHNNKYNYIREEFEPNYSQIKVNERQITRICKHGEVQISYHSHRKGKSVCNFCNDPEKETISRRDKFINKVKEVHSHLDLSEIIYKNQYNITQIKCTIHNIYFNVGRSSQIFKCKYGSCPFCIENKKDRFINNIKKKHPNKRKTKNQVILEANIVHNNRYDYSLFDYRDSKTKGIIICELHGQFNQTMDSHINKKANCPTCVKETNYITFEGKYNLAYFKNTESKNIKGTLYLANFKGSDEEFIKIGITSKTFEERFKYLYLESNYEVTLIKKISLTIYEAFLLEQKLLKKYKYKKYIPKNKFKGHTECFTCEIKEKLINEASVLTGAI